MEKSNRIRKVPTRSAMSDQELAAIIRRDREQRPQEFVSSSSVSSVARFNHIPLEES